MSFPTDDLARIHELNEQGESVCGIERYMDICRATVRNVLSGNTVLTNNELSTRQRQRLLSWRAA